MQDIDPLVLLSKRLTSLYKKHDVKPHHLSDPTLPMLHFLRRDAQERPLKLGRLVSDFEVDHI